VQSVYVIPTPGVTKLADATSQIVDSDGPSIGERQIYLVLDPGKTTFEASPFFVRRACRHAAISAPSC
jgi:hypothetical protein